MTAEAEVEVEAVAARGTAEGRPSTAPVCGGRGQITASRWSYRRRPSASFPGRQDSRDCSRTGGHLLPSGPEQKPRQPIPAGSLWRKASQPVRRRDRLLKLCQGLCRKGWPWQGRRKRRTVPYCAEPALPSRSTRGRLRQELVETAAAGVSMGVAAGAAARMTWRHGHNDAGPERGPGILISYSLLRFPVRLMNRESPGGVSNITCTCATSFATWDRCMGFSDALGAM
jgi:hypothetical protein